MDDLIIVGMGPSACTCAIYTSRYKMKVKMIGGQPGGQLGASGEENYPGFLSISGFDLAQKMIEQSKQSGTEVIYDMIGDITPIDGGFELNGSISGKHTAKQVLLATGTNRRKLNVPGEEALYGKGVTYCATCDGMFYKNQHVAVVGGGNAAAEAALYLADVCESVHVFIRKDHFKADGIIVEKLMANPKITVEFNTEIAEIKGDPKVDHVVLSNGEKRELTGVFIEIGADPEVTLAKKLGLELDETNYIKVDSGQRTSMKGILAAGDNTTASEKFAQDATAVGEGAVAAKAAYEFYQHNS